jgi:hypothetical protein
MVDAERGVAFSSRDAELGKEHSGVVPWKWRIYAVLHQRCGSGFASGVLEVVFLWAKASRGVVHLLHCRLSLLAARRD